MARFSYIGVTPSGKQVKGEIQAENKNEVVSLLRKKRYARFRLKANPWT